MRISVSTANLYRVPFQQVVEIYGKAGFDSIELVGFWEGGGSAYAQHLRDWRPEDVIACIRDGGLSIASYHDMGGLISSAGGSVITPTTEAYFALEAIPALVLHAPRRMGATHEWWARYRPRVGEDIAPYRDRTLVLMENLPPVTGMSVQLIRPEAMRALLEETGMGANVDTSHCWQAGVGLMEMARELAGLVRAVHFSDAGNGLPHRMPGEGELDLTGFLGALDPTILHAVTIECDLHAPTVDAMVLRAKSARERTVAMLERAGINPTM